MARSRFLLISTVVVAFAGVGAWYELERAELVVNATASPVPVVLRPGFETPRLSLCCPSTSVAEDGWVASPVKAWLYSAMERCRGL